MSMPDQSDFYQPLTNANAIRLLRCASITNNVTHFYLEEHDLSLYDFEEPSNGDELVFSADIQVDSKPFKATQNMVDALECALVKTTLDHIWMDQCCINQASLAERASQVGLMHRIYGQADLVLVWLGGPHPYASNFVWMTNEFCAIVDTWIQFMGSHVIYLTTPDQIVQASGHDVDVFKKRVGEAEDFYTLCRFFERAWVRQEVVLSKNLRMFCGNLEVSTDGLEKLASYFNHTSWSSILGRHREGDIPQIIRRASGFSAFGLWTGLRRNYQLRKLSLIPGSIDDPALPYLQSSTAEGAAMMMLWRNITRLQQSTCSDPRDKIYAAFALTKSFVFDKFDIPLVPRYDLPAEQVYISFCENTIRLTKSLWILAQVDAPSERLLKLPSWVKDFSSRNTGDWANLFSGHLYQQQVQSSGLCNSVQVDGTRLTSFGTPFAVISRRSGDTRIDPSSTYAPSLLGLLAEAQPYLDGVPRAEALSRTMISDTSTLLTEFAGSQTMRSQECPAPPETYNYFSDFLLVEFAVACDQKLRNGKSLPQVVTWLFNLFLPLRDEIDRDQFPSPASVLRLLLWVRRATSEVEAEVAAEVASIQNQADMFHSVGRDFKKRPIFLTQEGFMGNGPLDLEVGDEVWFVHSCNVLLIFRPCNEQSTFALIGPCYLHGFMGSRMFNSEYKFVRKWQSFTLV